MRYWWALSVLGLLIGSAQAEVPADEAKLGESAPALNMFGVPEQEIEMIDNRKNEAAPAAGAAENLPICNTAEMLARVQTQIAGFQNLEQPQNTYNRRQKELTIKNIGLFSEVNIAEFAPKDNYPTANRMIELKVNNHLTNADLRLCVSENEHSAQKLYLLIYPAQAGPRVDILNFKTTNTDRKLLSFQY